MSATDPLRSPFTRARGGVLEGATIGCFLLLFRFARFWWKGNGLEEFQAHLGEAGLYSAIVIVSTSYIFGVGRGISGGWLGSLAGAATLGIAGIWIGGQVFPMATGLLVGLLAPLGLGALTGALLGAFLERFFTKRGAMQSDQAPSAENRPGEE